MGDGKTKAIFTLSNGDEITIRIRQGRLEVSESNPGRELVMRPVATNCFEVFTIERKVK